jgi:Tfp pilus assembly protein PilF/uncharacterized caspase-like protein
MDLMKIKKLVFFLLVFFFLRYAESQTPAIQNNTPINKGNTYALIVGVSNYESFGIKKLRFSTKDAQNFNDYLLSKAGGSVPEENIRLLLDSAASFAAIYKELKWLIRKAKKNDLVYFYFSGHGDMENTTIYKLGFLLAQNTPRTNYINNALRIEDLNYYANTLSTKNEAKVILITDACHSGNLAGNDFRGNQLVGEQLRAVENNEIRITSCGPDELSAENAEWGNGSGVFSYYLLNGLKVLADADKNGKITLTELESFLKSKFADDEILKRDNLTQTPILNAANKTFELAEVDNSITDSVKKTFIMAMTLQKKETGTEVEQLQKYFYKLFKSKNPEEQFDFVKLDSLPKEKIAFALLKQFGDKNLDKVINQKLNQFVKLLQQDKDALDVFNDNLVVLLHDRGQKIINLYLEGDAAELERRRYYNSKSSNYDVYPTLFSVALKLTDSTDKLYRPLQIDKYYFGSVAARLKIPTVPNPDTLIDKAFVELRKALLLEKGAAFIYNELGMLYKLRKQTDSAEQNFKEATRITPKWAMPWSNLAGLYANTNKYEKGFQAADSAKKLQPDYQNTYVNMGILNEKKGNQLRAEEMFRKSIKMNTRHYLPFERLGYVYMNTTEYALSDSFFYEADIRMKPFNLKNYEPDGSPRGVPDMQETIITGYGSCNIDTLEISKDDVMGNFVLGLQAYKNGEFDLAERKFKQVISIDNKNPLAFHFLGKLLFKQERWQEGEIIFNYALKNYIDSAAFKKQVEVLKKQAVVKKLKDCIVKSYSSSYYYKIEDRYFLAGLYENWNHFAEAATQYKQIIKENKKFMGGYFKLWNMLERTGHFQDAENVIRSFAFEDKIKGQNELNAFYFRMTQLFPTDAIWFHKAGLFLYDLVAANPKGFPGDKKYFPPDEEEEIPIPYNDYETSKFGKLEEIIWPGIKAVIKPADSIVHPLSDGINYLLMADSLMKQADAVADINYKIGDLYVWQGLPEKASPYYKKSLGIKPGDANTRTKLTQTYAMTYLYQDALAQLDTLYNRKEINFTMQLLYSKYLIHSGSFVKAEDLIKEAEKNHPFGIPELTDLSGRLKFMSAKPNDALPFYQKYLAQNKNDYSTLYTLAKLYAQLGNKMNAWKNLEEALDKGFPYSYLLKNDSIWDEYRKDDKWNNIIIKKLKEKIYPKNKAES